MSNSKAVSLETFTKRTIELAALAVAHRLVASAKGRGAATDDRLKYLRSDDATIFTHGIMSGGHTYAIHSGRRGETIVHHVRVFVGRKEVVLDVTIDNADTDKAISFVTYVPGSWEGHV